MSNCYWILNDGKILDKQSRHILAVISAPELFGETEQSINETFKKYGQDIKSNYEGKAREAVMLRVIRRNHIRIRKNILKHQQHWSIQLYRLTDERRASISSWAKYIATNGDQYADVIIHQLFDNSKIQTSLNLLADGSMVDENTVKLKQTDILGTYK
jgi:hypothetical protein